MHASCVAASSRGVHQTHLLTPTLFTSRTTSSLICQRLLSTPCRTTLKLMPRATCATSAEPSTHVSPPPTFRTWTSTPSLSRPPHHAFAAPSVSTLCTPLTPRQSCCSSSYALPLYETPFFYTVHAVPTPRFTMHSLWFVQASGLMLHSAHTSLRTHSCRFSPAKPSSMQRTL